MASKGRELSIVPEIPSIEEKTRSVAPTVIKTRISWSVTAMTSAWAQAENRREPTYAESAILGSPSNQVAEAHKRKIVP